MKMIEKRQDFPESYYQETDPGRRQTLLLEALEREDTEENRIRKRLWELDLDSDSALLLRRRKRRIWRQWMWLRMQ